MSEVIEIVAYNPDWPRMFEKDRFQGGEDFFTGVACNSAERLHRIKSATPAPLHPLSPHTRLHRHPTPSPKLSPIYLLTTFSTPIGFY
jgi:hypothetical protein